MSKELIESMRDDADLCANESVSELAKMLNFAANLIEQQRKRIEKLESTLRTEEAISFRRQMQEYAAQRDELLWALELLAAGIENSVSETFIPLTKARAAIANTRKSL